MANLMNGDRQRSKILHAKTSFVAIVRASNGSLAGDWLFYISPDNQNWVPAHEVPFSETKHTDIIEAPFGAYFQIHGGTGSNIIVDVFYHGADAHLFNIDDHIFEEV